MPRGRKKQTGVAGRLDAILTQIHILQVDLATIEKEVSAYNNSLKALFGGETPAVKATPAATPAKSAKAVKSAKSAKATKAGKKGGHPKKKTLKECVKEALTKELQAPKDILAAVIKDGYVFASDKPNIGNILTELVKVDKFAEYVVEEGSKHGKYRKK